MYETILHCTNCGAEHRLVAEEVVAERDRYREALKAIRGPMDDPTGLDWRMCAYRAAGGGYEGLQAIAETALEPADG